MKRDIVKKLLQLKFEARSLVACEPSLSLLRRPLIWWQQYKILRFYSEQGASVEECIVGPHTEFVLDGFQGSGNSFAEAAFQRSQTQPVNVAHHMHSPAQIIKSVRLGLPTLVTVRDPANAVLSLTSRWTYVSVSQALRSYIRFYEKIEPYAAGYVLSSFEQTTKHLDDVIRSVNRRFDENFGVFEYEEEDMRALRGHKRSSSEKVERQDLKDEKARAFEQPHCRQLLEKAEALYQRLEPLTVGERMPEQALKTAPSEQ